MPNKMNKNNKFIFKSIKSKELSKLQIKNICLLKESNWKFGIKSQLKWFNSNVKKDDFHNLFYNKSVLVGYTCLKERTFENFRTNRKKKYLLFDSFIINKKYRGEGLSALLMNYNNYIISKLGLFSFLICEDKLVEFYKKYNWKKLNKKKIIIKDHKFLSNGLIFNSKNLNNKFIFYIKK